MKLKLKGNHNPVIQCKSILMVHRQRTPCTYLVHIPATTTTEPYPTNWGWIYNVMLF